MGRRNGALPFRTTGVRAYNDGFADIEVLSDPPQCAGLRIQVVDRHIEEALDLTGMQVHGDHMIAAGCLQHVRHELCRDGCTGFVFLILAGIGKVRDHGSDTTGGCGLAGVDDDEKFHEAIVDIARSGGLEDEDFDLPLALHPPK